MPVSSQVRVVIRDYDHVESPGRNRQLTSRAQVLLGRRMWLDRGDGHPEKIAHVRSPIATTNPTMSAATSNGSFFCSRKGLKPTPQR